MNQLALDYDRRDYPNVAGAKVSGTSEDAAKTITPLRQAAYTEILRALNEHGPMIPDRIAEKIGRSASFIRPRCSEMTKHHGLLVKTGHRERNDSGMWANVLDVKR